MSSIVSVVFSKDSIDDMHRGQYFQISRYKYSNTLHEYPRNLLRVFRFLVAILMRFFNGYR
jgi:hypothetical protein